MIRKHVFFCALTLFCTNLFAQHNISIVNPSFEDTPRSSSLPKGWTDCGDSKETPPDIQPGAFGVTMPAYDGKTCLGLVVRDNDSRESVGQQLQDTLKFGHFYRLNIALARSPRYISYTRMTHEQVNFGTPAKLHVWGGNQICERGELLAESSLISNTEWKEFTLDLAPAKNSWTFLILEAYYNAPVALPYNGNVLLDRISIEETGN